MPIHKRKALTDKNKLDIVLRQRHCPECSDKLGALKDLRFDHIIPLALGGTNELSNFQAMHENCHLVKTRQDVKNIAKTNRLRKKRLGEPAPRRRAIPSRPFPKRKKNAVRTPQPDQGDPKDEG